MIAYKGLNPDMVASLGSGGKKLAAGVTGKQGTPGRQGEAKKKQAAAETDMDRKPEERDYFTHKICEECGKEFTIQNCDLYVYKRHRGKGYHYYCSWGCYRKEGQAK